MATAVAEKEWTMPRPRRGEVVIFYARRTKAARYGEIGFVSKVDQQSLAISVNGQLYRVCYHRGDPRLKKNPGLYGDIDGTWEFCEDSGEGSADTKLESRIKRLESSVKKMTERMADLEKAVRLTS